MEMLGLTAPSMDWEDANLPQAWEKFERHVKLIFSGPMKDKSDAEKVSYILLWVGDKGRDVHQTWTLTAEEAKVPDTYFQKFKDYVQPKLNPIFARFKFNNIVQGSESIESYSTKLRLAAKDCKFTQSDDMIRDRIVFGVSSVKLREKLINEGEKLTLDSAIQISQNFEYSREQMKTMAEASQPGSVDRIQQTKRDQSSKQKQYRKQTKGQNIKNTCGYCGTSHSKHDKCPANGKQCHFCKKWNHFSSVCRLNKSKNKRVNDLSVEDDNSSEEEQGFIDIVGKKGKKVSQAHATIYIGKNQVPIKFKIDTGAMVNIIPNSIFIQLGIQKPLKPTYDRLESYSNNELDVLGTVDLACFYKNHKVAATFYVVETKRQPLLSLDTSVELELLKLTFAVDKTIPTDDILTEYDDLFQGIGQLPSKCKLHLKPDAIPVVNPARRVPHSLKERLREELNSMEEQSIIAKVTEPTEWVNSLVCVEKPKTGKLRICIDPKHLNDALLRPHYPMKTLEEVTSDLSGASYFSVLDAKSGYWSIKLTQESSYLCTFSTPFGRYRFLRLPFGIKVSQDEFQRQMDDCLEGLNGVTCIVDDILVYGKNKADHDKDLRDVLRRCRDKGIRLNREKSRIGLTEVPYFGHILTSDGLKPDQDKIKAILGMKPPKSRAELETLLGMVTYLSKFSSNLADLTSPLRALLKNDVHFRWDKQHDKAFEKVKKALTESPILAYFDSKKPITLQVDSSKFGIGACILQDGKPVVYASKSLTQTEIGYAQIEKEMLAILFGCKRFHHYVYGRRVEVQSDHKPIESIMKKPLAAAPARLQRMLLQLQSYDIQVTHVSGKSIPVADTLSRNYLDDTYSDLIEGLDSQIHSIRMKYKMSDQRLEEVRDQTARDTVLCTLRQTIQDGWPERRTDCPNSILQYWTFRDELIFSDGIIMKGDKILIPHDLRKSMLERIHIGHQGIVKCMGRARDVMYWPGMTNDITNLVNKCDICLRHRNANRKEPMKAHEIPEQPWQVVATAIFTLDGTNYLVTVDYYSRFFEVDRLPDTKSLTVIRKLKTHFARYGICQKLVSDNAAQFTSDQFAKFATNWGFKHVTSSPLYPQSNGLAEKTVQTVKRLIKKAKLDKQDIYLAFLEYRNSPLECGYSPSQLLMSKRLRSTVPTTDKQLRPKSVSSKSVQKSIDNSRSKQKQYYDRTAKPLPPLSNKKSIRVHLKNNWVPAKLLKDNNDRSYTVQTDNGGIYRRNRRFLMNTKEKQQHFSEENIPNILVENESCSNSKSETESCKSPLRSDDNFDLTETHPSDNGNTKISKYNADRQKPYVTRSGRSVKPVSRYIQES